MRRHAESRLAATAAARACRGGGRPGGRWVVRPRSSCCTRPATSLTPTCSSRRADHDAPRRRRRTAAQARPSAVDNFIWPLVRLRPRPHPRVRRAAPTCTRRCTSAGRFNDGALLEFPPVDLPQDAVSARRQRLGQGGQHAQRPRRSGTDQIGTLWPRPRPRSTPSSTSCSCRCCRSSGHSPGDGQFVALSMRDRPRRLVTADRRRQRVLADRPRRDRLLRRSGRHRLRAHDAQRPPVLDLPGQRRDQGRPGARQRRSCSSATTRATPTRSTRSTATRSGRSAPAGPTSGSARASSTRPRRSPSAASTWATPTGACTRSGRATGALAWATATGAYVYASAAVADPPGPRSDGLHRLLRRQLLRVQRPVGRGALAPPGGRQDLRLGDHVGNVVYYSDLGSQARRPASTRAPAAGVLVPRRRLHAGDRRLPRDLPDRLQHDLPDAAGPRPADSTSRRAKHRKRRRAEQRPQAPTRKLAQVDRANALTTAKRLTGADADAPAQQAASEIAAQQPRQRNVLPGGLLSCIVYALS